MRNGIVRSEGKIQPGGFRHSGIYSMANMQYHSFRTFSIDVYISNDEAKNEKIEVCAVYLPQAHLLPQFC